MKIKISWAFLITSFFQKEQPCYFICCVISLLYENTSNGSQDPNQPSDREKPCQMADFLFGCATIVTLFSPALVLIAFIRKGDKMKGENMVNRNYKDRLFKVVFGSADRKEYALSLYNAINLYEQQSTYNPNMPLRGLLSLPGNMRNT